MRKSNISFKIGNREIGGIWAILLGIIVLIPILAILGVILSLIFSIVGVVLTVGIGIALVGAVIAFIIYLLPEKLRRKLGINVKFSRTHTKSEPEKPTTTSDGKPIIDVSYQEDKK